MRIIAVILGLVLPLFACAQEDKAPAFEEGKHYTVLSGQPKPSKNDIVVTEVFWYGCGHCYNFEPLLNKWKKTLAKDVTFERSPAMWRQRRNPEDAMWTHAKLYYTAEAMGVLDKLHPVFFEAMHKKNKRLVDAEEIKNVVSNSGIDGKLFVDTMESFAVNGQVQKADQRQRDYKITGTPEIIVGGYYHVSASKAGSQQTMLDVTDFLVEKIRSGK